MPEDTERKEKVRESLVDVDYTVCFRISHVSLP